MIMITATKQSAQLLVSYRVNRHSHMQTQMIIVKTEEGISPSVVCYQLHTNLCRPGSSVGIVTDYGLEGPGIESRWSEIFRTCPDRPWDPPNLLYNGYWVFLGGKERPGRAADHSPPSSAAVMEE